MLTDFQAQKNFFRKPLDSFPLEVYTKFTEKIGEILAIFSGGHYIMKYGRTYNFSAGPAMMPEPVLEEIRDEMLNYRGSPARMFSSGTSALLCKTIIADVLSGFTLPSCASVAPMQSFV